MHLLLATSLCCFYVRSYHDWQSQGRKLKRNHLCCSLSHHKFQRACSGGGHQANCPLNIAMLSTIQILTLFICQTATLARILHIMTEICVIVRHLNCVAIYVAEVEKKQNLSTPGKKSDELENVLRCSAVNKTSLRKVGWDQNCIHPPFNFVPIFARTNDSEFILNLLLIYWYEICKWNFDWIEWIVWVMRLSVWRMDDAMPMDVLLGYCRIISFSLLMASASPCCCCCCCWLSDLSSSSESFPYRQDLLRLHVCPLAASTHVVHFTSCRTSLSLFSIDFRVSSRVFFFPRPRVLWPAEPELFSLRYSIHYEKTKVQGGPTSKKCLHQCAWIMLTKSQPAVLFTYLFLINVCFIGLGM